MNQQLNREFAHIEALREKIQEAQLEIDKAQNRLRQLTGNLAHALESLKKETEQALLYSTSMYIPPDLAREIRRIAGKVPVEENSIDDY